MAVAKDLVVKLRVMTSAGIMDCKNALKEAKGDLDKAVDILRKKGAALATKRAARAAKEGRIETYQHHGDKIAVLVEVNCETDFVARNDDFKKFSRDVAMQVAAASPLYVKREEVSKAELEREKAVIADQIKGKPAAVVEKIVAGKIDKYYSQVCLLEQPFIKDDKKTIQGYLTEVIGKIGENISIRRFVRYQLGEEA